MKRMSARPQGAGMLPPIVKKYGKSLARLVPQIDHAVAERDRLRDEYARLKADRDHLNHLVHHQGAPQFMPPGHFYSPIAATADVKRDEVRIFDRPREIPGIDLDEAGQLKLLEELKTYAREMPFPEKRGSSRFT